MPQGADLYGQALLVANLDGSATPELLVGAPDSRNGEGTVYVYRLSQDFFTNGMDPSYFDDNNSVNRKLITIDAPEGADSFGSALSYGPLDGTGVNLTAISAITTAVGGVSNAGTIYIYETLPGDPSIAELSSPRESDFLGDYLTTMPFVAGGATHSVLVASAKQSAMAFFSSLTENHNDVRER